MRCLMMLRGWPLAPQIAVALALAAVVAALAFGPANPEYNPGMYLLWGLWWALLPLCFVALGRLWCAICPVSLLGDLAARVLPGRLAFPSALARAAAVSLVLSLVAIHLANLWFQFEEDLRSTGVLLVMLGSTALLLTLAFRDRPWCRGLCPVGAVGGLLARLSPLRIANAAVACPQECAARACAAGVASRTLCPVLIDVRAGIDPGACILCGACLKVCSRLGDVHWEARPRNWSAAVPPAPDSLAALALLGLAVDMGLTHLVDWPILFWRLSSALGVPAGAWVETALHASIIAALPLGAFLLCLPCRAGRVFDARLARLAAPALPLAGAALLALTLRPLLVEGPLTLRRLLLVAGWEGAELLGALRRLDGLPLRVMQEGVVVVGVAVALLAALKRPGSCGAAADDSGGSLQSVALVVLAGTVLLWVCSRQMSG